MEAPSPRRGESSARRGGLRPAGVASGQQGLLRKQGCREAAFRGAAGALGGEPGLSWGVREGLCAAGRAFVGGKGCAPKDSRP
jgi:hypothetical protein